MATSTFGISTKSANGSQCIIIDSTYRDRTLYPNPCEFSVKYSGSASNPLTIRDPIVPGVTFLSGTTQAGSTATTVVLAASTSTLNNNQFINNVLQIAGSYVTITQFIAATQTATITPAIVPPGAGVAYNLRRGIPVSVNTLAANGTTSTAFLALTEPTTTNYYVGYYILFTTGLNATTPPTVKLIIAYNGTTKVATLASPFPNATAAGDAYEIQGNAYDSCNDMVYLNYSTDSPILYELKLSYLILPNVTLYSGTGGPITNYPYLYVKFKNKQGGSQNQAIGYANNQNSSPMTFHVPVNDINISSSFIKLQPTESAPIIKFTPSSDIEFGVYHLGGQQVKFAADDFSPLPPNPLLQVCASIVFTPVSNVKL